MQDGKVTCIDIKRLLGKRDDPISGWLLWAGRGFRILPFSVATMITMSLLTGQALCIQALSLTIIAWI